MDELGADIDIAGLAKQEEEIFLPYKSEPIRLPERSEALKTLQFVRDETHRFATGFNQRLRSADIGFSVLESIEGIGPKRAAALMKEWHSLENIVQASAQALADKSDIPLAVAKAVRAAARLSLEDREAKKEKLNLRVTGKRKKGTVPATDPATLAEAALAATDMAAEKPPEYLP
jgi:excinuclease ABC subunit C